MRGKGKLILWPAYFDTDYFWRQGRRVPKKLALRGVKADEIFKAANDLGMNPVLKSGAAHSKHPWIKTGAVLVDKTGTKTEALKELALKISRNRA